MSGIKPENSFSALSPLSPTVARCARHSHPSRPKKKPLRGKKVGSAEKKLRLTQKMAHRVYHGWHVPACGDLPQPTLRGSLLWLRCLQLRSASPRLNGVAHLPNNQRHAGITFISNPLSRVITSWVSAVMIHKFLHPVSSAASTKPLISRFRVSSLSIRQVT